MPRGLGSFVAMFVVGRLIGRGRHPADPVRRALTAAARRALADDALRPVDGRARRSSISGIIQGLGIGLLFVPLRRWPSPPCRRALRAEGIVGLHPGPQPGLQRRHLDHAGADRRATPRRCTLAWPAQVAAEQSGGHAPRLPRMLDPATGRARRAERRDHPPGVDGRLCRRFQADADHDHRLHAAAAAHAQAAGAPAAEPLHAASTRSLRSLAASAVGARARRPARPSGPNFKRPTAAAAGRGRLRHGRRRRRAGVAPQPRRAGRRPLVAGVRLAGARPRDAPGAGRQPDDRRGRRHAGAAPRPGRAPRAARQRRRSTPTPALQRERINLAAFGFTGFPGHRRSQPDDQPLFDRRRRSATTSTCSAASSARPRPPTPRPRPQAPPGRRRLSDPDRPASPCRPCRSPRLRAQIAAAQQVVADDRSVIDMVRKAEARRRRGAARRTISGARPARRGPGAAAAAAARQLDAARHQLALLVGKSPAEWTAPDFDLAELHRAGRGPGQPAVAAGAPPARHPGRRGRPARGDRRRSASRSPSSIRTSGSPAEPHPGRDPAGQPLRPTAPAAGRWPRA